MPWKLSLLTFALATACAGAGGERGASGAAGKTSIVTTTRAPAGDPCAEGGVRITSGLDADGDGVLDDGEVTTTRYVCDGAPGNDGEHGMPGDRGDQGDQGPPGPQGPPGDSGGAGNCEGATPIEITGVTGVEHTPYFRGFASAPITVATNAQDPQLAFVTTGVTFESTGTAGEYTFTPAIVGEGIGVAVIATDGCTTAIDTFVIPSVTPPQTTVRIVHLYPDAATLDIRESGSSTTLRAVSFGASTQPLVVESGDYTFDVVVASDDSVALTSPQLMLTPGADVTLVAHSVNGALALMMLNDDVSTPSAGNARIRAVHAADGRGTLDVRDLLTSSALLTGLPSGGASATLELPAGAAVLGLDEGQDGTVDASFVLPALADGSVVNLFAYLRDGEPELFVQHLAPDTSQDVSLPSSLSAPVPGNAFTLPGTLDASDAVWRRPSELCANNAVLNYRDVYEVTNLNIEPVMFTATSAWSAPLQGALYLYQSIPDGSSGGLSARNCMGGRFADAGSSSAISKVLAPGERVVVIVSAQVATTAPEGVGDYALTFSSDTIDEGPFINMTAVPIPANGAPAFVSSSVMVAPTAPGCLIDQVFVDVEVRHLWRNDLRVKLTSAQGTEVMLHDTTGGSAKDIIGTYPLTIAPAQPLSALTGELAAGVWTLSAQDTFEVPGTLAGWSITFTCQ